jgi:hypothetical protein
MLVIANTRRRWDMLWKSWMLALALLPGRVDSAPAIVIFVDDSAVGGANNGTSWEDAFVDLQSALAIAKAGDEIRVGQGLYKPTTPGGFREASFHLVNGTTLQGGYAGVGAADPDANDPTLYETILSGDLNGDDGPHFTNYTENSYHVARANNLGSGTRLAGVTMSHGSAAGTLVDCSSTNLYSAGGGMRCTDSTLTIEDCLIEHNRARCEGGGMMLSGGAATLRRCQFQSNSVIGLFGFGRGGALSSSGPHHFFECAFQANASPWYGGGIAANGGRFHACAITDNSAGESSGGMTGSGFVLVDCLIDNNHSGTFVGAMSANNADLINCRFTRNRNSICGVLYGTVRVAGNVRAVNCVFLANAGSSPAICVSGSGNLIMNCSVVGNTPPWCAPGGIRVEGDLTLANSILWANTAEILVGEAAQIRVMPSARLSVSRSCIQGWTGTLGGVGNHGNDPRFIDADGPDNIYGTADDNPRLRANSPCIDTGDSLLLPADTFDLDEDGDTTEPLPIDLDGLPRVVGASVDSGAYEFQGISCRADIDGSSTVDSDDLVTIILAWGACEVGEPCPADLTLDGAVTADDLVALILGWGACP